MKLRRWQEECLSLALCHYTHRNHFLCLATPGAGKTVLAAELARRLIANNQIDLVLCFSPSVTVANGMRRSLEARLGRRVDGVMGAAGGVYTYQNLMFFKQGFWSLLDHQRVLVIFDEIHHCSGTTPENANAWGEEILLRIQDKAVFTLALTGTPWRSDKAPIVLSRYLNPEGHIQCDYRYSLRDAIRDGVCRTPKIVLIENEHITVTSPDAAVRSFTSLHTFLQEEGRAYSALIQQDQAIRYMLGSACARLKDIRRSNPAAAGLVIAASVRHAERVAQLLRSEFGCQASVVSYQQPDSADLIQQFRTDSSSWIVSVGMISEGTDIPRLQVCCHLSPIKTELHYRQVLGRILRRTTAPNQEAWLYTFAEPTLVEYANRIAEDVPFAEVVIRDRPSRNAIMPSITGGGHGRHRARADQPLVESVQAVWNAPDGETCWHHAWQEVFASSYSWGLFREEVIATFDSPFQSASF